MLSPVCTKEIVVQCYGNQNFIKLCGNYTKVKFKSKDILPNAPKQDFFESVYLVNQSGGMLYFDIIFLID